MIDVLAILRYQHQVEQAEGFDDVLIIGGTCTRDRQAKKLAEACRALAQLGNFRRILEIKWLERLYRVGWWNFAGAIQRLRTVLGPADVRTVYSARNGQFANELVLSAFPQSRKICYGDVGTLALNTAYGERVHNPAGFCAMDDAYLTFPSEFEEGGFDRIRLTVLPHRFYLSVLEDASRLDAVRRVTDRYVQPGRAPTALVLTSNLTESRTVSSLDQELEFYSFCTLPYLTPQDRIVIKGHPRETRGQAARFARRLRDLGYCAEPIDNASHLPIDLLAPALPVKKVLSNVSYGVLAFALIHGCDIVAGCGREGERRYLRYCDPLFAEVYEKTRILLIEQAYAKSFRPLRLHDVRNAQVPVGDYPVVLRAPGAESADAGGPAHGQPLPMRQGIER